MTGPRSTSEARLILAKEDEPVCAMITVVAVKFLQAGVLPAAHDHQALFNEVSAAKEVQHEHVLRTIFSSDRPTQLVKAQRG